MPPQRTFPPVKAVKTERTHEENQERAYIAASRRSDRSLEARVESARRASEIHKRRTGRSLRVTEQDVINEEMYEEEDDDLPMQYRRLTAHLQTGSADFNRRLAAYLTNHVAMRSALDEAVNTSFAQQYPNAPQFAHNHTVFPSPLSNHNLMQPPQQKNVSASQQSPHPYRQIPYPIAPPSLKGQHSRSASFAVAPQASSAKPVLEHKDSQDKSPERLQLSRRASMPAVTSSTTGTGIDNASPDIKSESFAKPSLEINSVNGGADMNASMSSSAQTDTQASGYPEFAPLTTTLPAESQMFFGTSLDPSHPFTSALMGGNDVYPLDFSFEQPDMSKQNNFYPRPGINATLAPSALEFPSSQGSYDMMSNIFNPPQKATSNDGFDWNMNDLKSFNPGTQSAFGSGSVTPGIDAGWDAFINDNSWSENTT